MSNAVLTGEAAIARPGMRKAGNKVRDLTEDEIRGAQAAEKVRSRPVVSHVY